MFAVLPALQSPQTRDLLEAQARANASEGETAELKAKLALAEESNLRLRESFTTFERTVNTVLDRLTPQDRQAADEAVDRAAKARAQAPPRPPLRLPGVEAVSGQVFVLMPFREELEPIYQIIQEAGQRAGLQVMRADEIMFPGRITDQISDAIERASLIVADITGQNANVLFEVGMANALGKDILIISQDREGIPFDIREQRVIFYENTIRGAETLREQLAVAMNVAADMNG